MDHDCAPHVAQDVRRDGARGIHDVRTVLLGEFGTDVAVQVVVERLHLLPEAVRLRGEVVRRHVVARPPHRAGVVVAEAPGALVRELDEALVVRPYRRRNRPPALPGVEQRAGVPAVVDHVLQIVERTAGIRPARTVPAGAVGRFHPGRDLAQFLDLRLVGRRGHGQSAAEQVELARHLVRLRRRLVGRRLLREVDRAGQRLRAGTGRQGGRVLVDVRRLHPGRAAAVVVVLHERLLRRRRELGRRRPYFAGAAGKQDGRGSDQGQAEGAQVSRSCSGLKRNRRHDGSSLYPFRAPTGARRLTAGPGIDSMPGLGVGAPNRSSVESPFDGTDRHRHQGDATGADSGQPGRPAARRTGRGHGGQGHVLPGRPQPRRQLRPGQGRVHRRVDRCAAGRFRGPRRPLPEGPAGGGRAPTW